MDNLFDSALSLANNFSVVKINVIQILGELRTTQDVRVGFVSGMITSQGPQKIAGNTKKLMEYTDIVSRLYDFPVFSAASIFTLELSRRVNADAYTPDEWKAFWKDIVLCGYITDIFMAPHWSESIGAREEHRLALRVGIPLHYLAMK